ncbi:MAG TPA: hypothetical protein DDW23_00135 [Planctomycetes bacterium]|nr:hypothetical protein [Planctomycetota bacterium]
MKFHDISPTLSERIGVFPGDVPFSRAVSHSIDEGDHLDLSCVTTTLHVGAHADAPSHYVGGGEDIGERSLEPYYGPCQVMEVAVAPGARILPSDLQAEVEAPRVLLKTGSFPDPENWNGDFASCSPDLIDFFHDSGVVLVGIDTPSVDPEQDKELLSHAAVARHNLSLLEGLVLGDVAAEIYHLVAFPLKIKGADASPVRAVLIEE